MFHYCYYYFLFLIHICVYLLIIYYFFFSCRRRGREGWRPPGCSCSPRRGRRRPPPARRASAVRRSSAAQWAAGPAGARRPAGGRCRLLAGGEGRGVRAAGVAAGAEAAAGGLGGLRFMCSSSHPPQNSCRWALGFTVYVSNPPTLPQAATGELGSFQLMGCSLPPTLPSTLSFFLHMMSKSDHPSSLPTHDIELSPSATVPTTAAVTTCEQ